MTAKYKAIYWESGIYYSRSDVVKTDDEFNVPGRTLCGRRVSNEPKVVDIEYVTCKQCAKKMEGHMFEFRYPERIIGWLLGMTMGFLFGIAFVLGGGLRESEDFLKACSIYGETLP